MNSGSEGVELSMRITDAHAKAVAGEKKPLIICMRDGFHGRTYRAATASDSCREKYEAKLQSFHNLAHNVRYVGWNDSAELEAVFNKAVEDGLHVECVICEPVQGEGQAGMALSREFYSTARKLTVFHNSMLIVDSVQ